MAAITSVRVQHVRTHLDYTLAVSPSTTLITGPNGSGKTSLIEAVYIALQGVSFKGLDTEIITRQAEWYRIDIIFDDKSTRTVKYYPDRPYGRKQFIIHQKTHYRLAAADKHPVVLFEPDDLRLLNGSPARRRQFINQFISQIDPRYAVALRRYERALKQRNTLLKNGATHHDELFAWNVSLSEYGAYIISQRMNFITALNRRIESVYQSIATTNDSLELAYSTPYPERSQQKLLDELHHTIHKDSRLGYTSVGPHRHDILFHFNGDLALSVASRGEIRSIVLALKFIEVDIVKEYTKKEPIVLLDDVFSELDTSRQKMLIRRFKDHQTIIASVEAAGRFGAKTALGG